MELPKPDKLPTLSITFPDGIYGESGTFTQKEPVSRDMAKKAFEVCMGAINDGNDTIVNMFPAHVGGKEQFDQLLNLANKRGVAIRHLKGNGEYGIIGKV